MILDPSIPIQRCAVTGLMLLCVGCTAARSAPSAVKSTPDAIARPAPSNPSPMTPHSIPIQILDFGQTPLHESFTSEPQVVIFQDSAAWAKFWQRSKRLDLNLQKPPAPPFNFANQTMIGLTVGSHATGGYSLRVERIEKVKRATGEVWVIHYHETAPGQDCLVTQAPTTPVVFVTVPKFTGPVELQGKSVVVACGKLGPP
jgi:PrcB C-terminal